MSKLKQIEITVFMEESDDGREYTIKNIVIGNNSTKLGSTLETAAQVGFGIHEEWSIQLQNKANIEKAKQIIKGY